MASVFTTSSLASEASRTDTDANVIRTVKVHGHRTTIRCEPQIWERLAEICSRESCTPDDVCSCVEERKPVRGSLASWLRMFIVDYFRAAATEDGHGRSMFLAQQLERQHICAKKTDGKRSRSRKRRARSGRVKGAGSAALAKPSGEQAAGCEQGCAKVVSAEKTEQPSERRENKINLLRTYGKHARKLNTA
jgi:predicted DNA-binding ribbon-helix-helix protein